MKVFTLLLAFISFPTLAGEAYTGSLSLYRWNKGFRAEAVRSAELKVSEAEFREILASDEPPAAIKDSVYSGCYLASYRLVNRGPASIGTPSSEVHRICWPRK